MIRYINRRYYMGLNASKVKSSGGGTVAEPIEGGTYPARVAQVIDLGLQPQRPFKGQEKPPAHQMWLTYELVDEFHVGEDGEPDEDRPRWISEQLVLHSLKADRAKSTQRYNALDPKMEFGGDFAMLGNTGGNVTITTRAGSGEHAGKVFNNIQTVTAVRSKDLAKMEPLKEEAKVFLLDEPDMEVFESLPDWLQDKIKGNLEYDGSELQKLLEGGSTKSAEKPVAEDGEDEVAEDDVVW
jgi:hypothetical protein